MLFKAPGERRKFDRSISAKTNGFLKQMVTFEYYFLLTMMVGIFEKIEILNKELERSELCAVDSHRKVEGIIISLEETRDLKFETIWEKAEKESQDLELEEPRHHTVHRRIDVNPDLAHQFNTPQEYYSKIFYKVSDCVLSSLKERFDASTLSHLDKLENFLIGK